MRLPFGSSGECPPVLFRSQSTRRQFIKTKGFWFAILGFIGGHTWDVLLLSEPPWLVSYVSKSLSANPDASSQMGTSANVPTYIGVLTSACVVTFLLWMIWRQRTREIRTQAALRDFSQEVAELIKDIRHVSLAQLCDDCCSAAVKVFESQLPKKGIGCAIRLRGDSGFETYSRAGRLSPSRKKSSTPVSFTGALAHLLESDEAQTSSVILIPDVEAAYASQQLERDKNSERKEFADEVKSMAIARIISFDSRGEANLAGIFYVTSDKKNGLNEESIDLVVTVSTMVSEIIREKLDVTNMSAERVEQFRLLINKRQFALSQPKTVRGEKSGKKKKGNSRRK